MSGSSDVGSCLFLFILWYVLCSADVCASGLGVLGCVPYGLDVGTPGLDVFCASDSCSADDNASVLDVDCMQRGLDVDTSKLEVFDVQRGSDDGTSGLDVSCVSCGADVGSSALRLCSLEVSLTSARCCDGVSVTSLCDSFPFWGSGVFAPSPPLSFLDDGPSNLSWSNSLGSSWGYLVSCFLQPCLSRALRTAGFWWSLSRRAWRAF